MMRRAFRARLSVALAVLSLCPAAPAAACELSFPPAIEARGGSLALNGQGWRIVSPWGIRAYAAALYQPSITAEPSEALRLGRPWAIEMVYCRDAPVAAIRDAWLKSLRANCVADCVLDGTATETFLATLRDARPWARWRFTFDGQRTDIREDQIERGAVAGTAFARALLGTWIGEAPPTVELRRALLGRK